MAGLLNKLRMMDAAPAKAAAPRCESPTETGLYRREAVFPLSTFCDRSYATPETLRTVFGADRTGGGTADGAKPVVGSVKSMIGHTKATAGVAGLIKAALALRGLPAGPTRVALDPPTPVQREAIAAAVATVA